MARMWMHLFEPYTKNRGIYVCPSSGHTSQDYLHNNDLVQNYGYAAGFTACAAVATALALVMAAFHSEPLMRRAGVRLPPATPGT